MKDMIIFMVFFVGIVALVMLGVYIIASTIGVDHTKKFIEECIASGGQVMKGMRDTGCLMP